jgi:hypothetical protein
MHDPLSLLVSSAATMILVLLRDAASHLLELLSLLESAGRSFELKVALSGSLGKWGWGPLVGESGGILKLCSTPEQHAKNNVFQPKGTSTSLVLDQ